MSQTNKAANITFLLLYKTIIMPSQWLSDVFKFALLVLTLSSVIHGAVVRVPTIDNPCGSDPTSTGVPQYSAIRDQIQSTITTANTADTMCQQFKTALKEVLTPSEIEDLDSPTENIPGLPLGLNEPTLTAANNISSFKNDYGDISIYIRHIEYLLTAQLAFDKGRFRVEIDAVKSQFYIWLCKTDTILKSQNSPVTQFVNSSVVSEDVKDYASSSKGHYQLNYVLMKNAHQLINRKTMKLANFLQSLS